MRYSPDVLKIDTDEVVRTIAEAIRRQVREVLRRRGAVLGVSGGVDSAVCAALCVLALGKENVLALFMPERESSGDSIQLGKLVVNRLEIRSIVEDITPILDGARCYSRRGEAIRSAFPEYGEGWKCKISIPSFVDAKRLNILRLTVQSPDGEQKTARLSLPSYLQLIAGTNMKQRTRKSIEYYHADRLNYAVCGTPNRLEYDQGFFVKNGDGAADFKPIAHLYKTQVYALANALGIPGELVTRTPTTDTYSLEQTQEEFYFAVPYDTMDLCLHGYNHGVAASEVGPAIGLATEQVERIYRDIESKRRSTRYLHYPPLLVEEVKEIHREIAGDPEFVK